MVSYENDIYDKIQNNITFLTYNIWGLLKNADNPDIYKTLLDTFKIRMKAILDIIEENRPDIICFQEVTNEVLEILNKELIKTYPYSFEPYFNSKDIKQYRGKNVECMIFSKYRPKKFNLYNITGSLNYANTICTIEFDNLIVINCYLQAGSKHSPGQTKHWYHHARCRMQELKVLGKIISESKKQNVVVMGDFNFNIKGNIDEWPENKILEELELDDVWSKINKDDPGYTENTDINKMRWNTKFQEKKFRYDGVLIKGKIKPNEIKIVGNKEIEISEELSDRIKKYWILQIEDIESKIKYYNKKEKILSLCPSDHFGVFCRLEIIE
jgi:exonuclease III